MGALLRRKLNTITQETSSKHYMANEKNIQQSRQISTIICIHARQHTNTSNTYNISLQIVLHTAEPVSTGIENSLL